MRENNSSELTVCEFGLLEDRYKNADGDVFMML